MTSIDAFARSSAPGVAGLYERVIRSGSDVAPPPLAPYFETLFLDHPWSDPDLPSLIYRNDDGKIVGFLGSHVRRFRFDGREIRVACGGPLVTDAGVRGGAPGVYLLRRFVDGPQDVSITDSANDAGRRLWLGVGARSAHLNCVTWYRVFRPFRFAQDMVAKRRQAFAVSRVFRPVFAGLDAAAARVPRISFRPGTQRSSAVELTPSVLLDELPEIAKGFRLLPDYDHEYVKWLFREVAAVTGLGSIVARLVRNSRQRALGWYVYYLRRGGTSHVVSVVARERDAGVVLDHLFADAYENGAAALHGRVEAHLLEAVHKRQCLFRYDGSTLVHSRERELADVIVSGDALFTRLEGEWWTGPQFV